MTTYLLALAVALGAGATGIMILESARSRRRVQRRLQPFGSLLGVVDSSRQSVADTISPKAGTENMLAAWLEERFPLVGGVKAGLISAGVAVLTFALLVPTMVFLQLLPALAILLATGLALAAAYSVAITLEGTQQENYNDRFLLAMEDLQRMVRFGIPSMQALNSVADAAEEPLKTSLRNILFDTGFGIPLEQAMTREAHRVHISELAMLAAILSTQASTGGNLSESVGNLATMLRERRDNRTKMKSITAESRVTMMMLGAVPIAAVAIQWKTQPELVETLFGDARHLLGIGLMFITAAVVVSWLLMRSARR